MEKNIYRSSLVVQWLRLHTSTAGDAGSIPGQEAKIPHAAHEAKRKKKQVTLWEVNEELANEKGEAAINIEKP